MNYYERRLLSNIKTVCTVIVVVILFILILNIGKIIQSTHPKEYTITVTTLTSKRYGNSEKWLVFAKDKKTGELYEFENTDNLFLGKWDSSSIQNYLQEENTYTIKTKGFRVKWLSWYPNIVDVEGRP